MRRPNDKPIHTFVKVTMTAIWLWSGFFWCGITMLYFLLERADAADSRSIALKLFWGSVILLLALILSWLRLYIIQIVPAAVGLIVFLNPVREMMEHVANSGVVFKPGFEVRYLPTVAFGILSLCLLIARLWGIHTAKAARLEEYNSSPAASILDKRKDEKQGNAD